MFKNKLGKKALAAILAVSMVASMSGCGKSEKKKDDKEVDTKTAENTTDDKKKETSDKPAKKTKISVYRACFNLAQADEANVKEVQDKINEYIGDKINVEIELHDIGSGEYQEKANMALMSGEIDLLWTAHWEEAISCKNIVKQNAVYDFTDIIKNYDLYNAFPEWVWGSSAFNGRNYFIPCYKEAAEGYNLAYRQDLVDKFGWDLSKVTSLKDIEPMLADCKKDGIKYPYLTQRTAMFYRYYVDKYDFFTSDSFIAIDKEKNEVVDTVTTPEYKEFTTLMCDWAEKGYLHEDDLTKTTTETTTHGKDWGITWWTNVPNNDEASTRWEQGIAMSPITKNWLVSNGTLGSCYCISSKCSEEKVDACLKFLSLLYTDKIVADLYTFGIEGKNYNIEDGKVAKIKDSGYDHSMWESTTVTVLSLEVGEPDNKVKMYEDFNESADDSIADGFRFDLTNVEEKYTACKAIFDEYGYVAENGGFAVKDVDKQLAAYQAALDDAGYQDVLAEAQAQYKAWLETK